ncbi:MerR family transcriptional regulator [Kytococcus sp. Marseille-QA3725]
MRIAEAAEQVGVPTHRLRHYEAVGLVVPDRTTAGYRDYSAEQVARARQVKALFDTGFTARDVTLMLPCMESDPAPEVCCEVTRARLAERLGDIRERREQLQTTEDALAEWLGAGEAGG